MNDTHLWPQYTTFQANLNEKYSSFQTAFHFHFWTLIFHDSDKLITTNSSCSHSVVLSVCSALASVTQLYTVDQGCQFRSVEFNLALCNSVYHVLCRVRACVRILEPRVPSSNVVGIICLPGLNTGCSNASLYVLNSSCDLDFEF